MGLSRSGCWDDPTALRGERLGPDALAEHAKELAVAHGPPAADVPLPPFTSRFTVVRGTLQAAYTRLARASAAKHDPSPAEEWLLDNSHIVADQLREIEEDLPSGYLKKLPRLGEGPMAGYPRVYGLCLDYLRHTDARIDFESLVRFVSAYEEVSVLTIGEIWAVPIMLRMGLVLSVTARAAVDDSGTRSKAERWCARLVAPDGASALRELRTQETPDAFVVELMRRLREHEAPAAHEWIRSHCASIGTTPEELARQHNLRQSADQLSVGNAITSMRSIAALSWEEFFERVSHVEAALKEDPGGTYAATDAATRDRCRHAIEDIARRSPASECDVAKAAIRLARESRERTPDDPGMMHVGYYLIDRGRTTLEAAVEYRSPTTERVRRWIEARPLRSYLVATSTVLAMIVAACAFWASTSGASAVLAAAVVVLLLLPASEIALNLVNTAVSLVFPPRVLAKMELEEGVPDAFRTLVAVPCMLDGQAGIEKLLRDLEIRYLGNEDSNLHYALVTDFTDHTEAHAYDDEALLALAISGIEALNRRYGAGPESPRFLLCHRRRLHNEREHCWMGWERKRGKIEELNLLLRGNAETSFVVCTAPTELLGSFKYVLTLDADTALPRETARRLVATLAHPLNHARIDARTGRVVRGYGLLQPRVGTRPRSSRTTAFARLTAGPSGIDPYTSAVSDVYQDLFAEGSYVGKGLYDVDAFAASLAERVPENTLLSHDLFEGLHARTALVTDVELLDDQPSTYAAQAKRDHRWIRGDWQLLPWLFGKGPGAGPSVIDLSGRFRIFDNLRRSLVPVSLVAALVVAWIGGRALAAIAFGVVVALVLAPLFARLLVTLARRSSERPWTPTYAPVKDLVANALQGLFSTTLLLDRALLVVDAVARTLHRLFVSRRGLLEWTTSGQAERQLAKRGPIDRRTLAASGLAIVGLAVVVGLAPSVLLFAGPLLLLWACAPLVVRWLAQPLPTPPLSAQLDGDAKNFLRKIALKTWLFFEEFVGAEDNHLPPDNFQEQPRPVVAHRTSPTNIGLYLLSTVAARDFGFITLDESARRIAATLATLARLEKRDGHILNWYDTTTLEPLQPRYVSTVDSGNLAGYLVTLSEATTDLVSRPVLGARVAETALDALRLIQAREKDLSDVARLREQRAALHAALEASRTALDEALPRAVATLVPLVARATELAITARSLGDEETTRWAEHAERGLRAHMLEARQVAPWAEDLYAELTPPSAEADPLAHVLHDLAMARSLADVARLTPLAIDALPAADDVWSSRRTELRTKFEASSLAATELVDRFTAIAKASTELADGMNFRPLFDKERALFSIGYNVSSGKIDESHYDLLASEARLASFFAIAKGDVPVEHWFRLGRARADLASGPVLLSWSGSMFEFLMPLLVMRRHDRTLLGETYASAVDRQIAYGRERGVPWGISESAYNTMDLAMNYQYRAFGVPGLGLKAGLGKDLVVAPYATVLAGLVRPAEMAENLVTLERDGLLGKHGFYDAVDYTPAHLPPNRKSVIVRNFMAHHQGMSLVALDDILHGDVMQSRFHRNARVMATELLLEERIPANAPVAPTATAAANVAPPPSEPELEVVDHVGLDQQRPIRAHLLGHGELSTLVTATGTGFTTYKGMDVHRYREDAAVSPSGIAIYLRDLDSGEVWSIGHQPTRKRADVYDVAFAADKVEIRRRDGDIEALLEIVVSPEHPAEVRRISLTNHGDAPRRLEVTTYMEVVLAPRAADLSHPAFSSMFVEVDANALGSGMLARRRPRGSSDDGMVLVQVLAPENGEWQALETETSRARFLGRGNTPAMPAALSSKASLGRRDGAGTLDPVMVLRRRVDVPSKDRVRATLTTALGQNRADAIAIGELFTTPASIARAFDLAWIDARVELRHLGITALQAKRFQELLSFVLQPCASLRHVPTAHELRGTTRESLWAQGISGDLPIVVVRIDDDASDLVREVVLAHQFWRLNGLEVDLVFLNEEPGGYLQPVQEATLAVIASSPAQGQLNQRGGVHVRRSDQMAANARSLLLLLARAVLVSSGGSLARQLRGAQSRTLADGQEMAAPSRKPSTVAAPMPRPELRFDNGLGGFSQNGREYVMTLGGGARTPAPWCNVLSNPSFGAVVSEVGSAFTWSQNSQAHRLTPWSNDAVSDPSGETFYLRDEDTRTTWSATPAPLGGDRTFEVRHAQGYSTFRHVSTDILHELVTFVDVEAPVKLTRLTLTNQGSKPRNLSVFGVVEWVLSGTRDRGRLSVVTEWQAAQATVIASSQLAIHPERRAFFATSADVKSFTCDREEFFGIAGSRSRPAALRRAKLDGQVGASLDPCAALQVGVSLAPGETVTLVFALGEGRDAEHASELARTFRTAARAETSLGAVHAQWDRILGAITVRTPDPALDVMVNRWLLYQVLAARVWSRTAFYQSGGAYGFRDQLQDVLALVHVEPSIAREHILRAAARQFVEGDVQHWWHPHSGEGVRTHCSDDLVWLPFVIAHYVKATGDREILDEVVPFLEARTLKPGEHDLFNAPPNAAQPGSLYEHATRALDAAMTQGPHGLPLMRAGDWNDGMSAVGAEGIGESIWLAWFIVRTLRDFIPIARGRGDAARVARCSAESARLLAAVEAHGWDGRWYRRAIFDDGSPLGSSTSAECRIDAIAQSWAVLAGADQARASAALRTSEEELVCEDVKLMRLLTPPFQGLGPDPGYIKAYPAGVRENGGQYTHGVLWTALAEVALGDGDRAAKLLSLFNPIHHATDAATRERYAVEPYALAADVYHGPGLEGRGGWTWYTGGAAWMYRIIVEHLLGLQLREGALHIAPCIPSAWPRFEVDYATPRGTLLIRVENPHGRSGGAVRVEVDGVVMRDDLVPLTGEGRREVRVTILAPTLPEGGPVSSPGRASLASR